jgi:putative FmdB family regulatory protein
MPLYEYECTNCKERVEIIQRSSDPRQEYCPKCGAEMKKLISSPAIQFKGSGFYKTDYAASKSTESKSETKSESKSSESKPAESKGESSTPAPKTETKSESKPD